MIPTATTPTKPARAPDPRLGVLRASHRPELLLLSVRDTRLAGLIVFK